MSENTQRAASVSRRGFLKATGLAVGALSATGAAGMMGTATWLSPAAAIAEPVERTASIHHMNHCEGKCSLKCTARDGRLCMIQPQNWTDKMERTVCVKGLSEIERVYGEGRVQSPLKRAGERGDGNYIAVSWDEALADIKEKLGAVIDEYGPQSVLLCGGSEQLTSNCLAPVMGFQGITAYAIDGNYPNGVGEATGQGWIEGDGRDLVNTRTFLNMGNNGYETALITAHVFNAARDAGCHFITVDPYLSTTAGKSDQWVPINPGSDHALLMALAQVVIENGWTDEAFMREHTAFPYLVSAEDGTILRAPATAEDIEAARAQAEEAGTADLFDPAAVAGKPLVYDEATNSVADYASAAVPALVFETTVDGKKCETAYSLLVKQYASYTPEWAEDITGISADDICALADRYANQGPSYIHCSYGAADKYPTGDIAGHAAVVLAAITGNFGKHGSGVGLMTAPVISGTESAQLGEWVIPEEYLAVSDTVDEYLVTKQPETENITKGILYFGNIISYVGDFKRFKRWLDEVDYYVVIDPFMTPGSMYADLILPACTRFEDSEEIGGAFVVNNHLTLKQKVIEPLFDSKTDLEIEREIAKLFGVEAALPASAAELVAAQFAGAVGLDGITVEDVVANGGCYELFQNDHTPLVDFEGGVFPTSTGRLEVYYESLIDFDQALPAWEANDEVDNEKLAEKYPLTNAQPRSRFRIHSEYCEAEWIRQYCGIFMEMNPIDMEERGLVEGDEIEAFNDRGTLLTVVHGNVAVRPGTTRMFENPWPQYTKGTHLQSLTSSRLAERGYRLAQGPMIPFNDTRIEVRKAGE